MYTKYVAQQKRDLKLPRVKSDCNKICEPNYQCKQAKIRCRFNLSTSSVCSKTHLIHTSSKNQVKGNQFVSIFIQFHLHPIAIPGLSTNILASESLPLVTKISDSSHVGISWDAKHPVTTRRGKLSLSNGIASKLGMVHIWAKAKSTCGFPPNDSANYIQFL